MPGITSGQRRTFIDGIVKTTKTRAWRQAVAQNGWTPASPTGDAFGRFVEDELASPRTTMTGAGII